MASLKANCRKIVCIGRNYAQHISELSSSTPTAPFFFLKPPSSLLPPGAGPVIRPRGAVLHHEVELGIVIGRTVRNLPDYGALARGVEGKGGEGEKGKGEAVDTEGIIAGYVLALDMTARNVQDHAKDRGLPWTIAKGFDTFCPVSEVIPVKELPSPWPSSTPNAKFDVLLNLNVNSASRQSGSTRDMLFPIPRLLSDISRVMTLEPGDLVLTGTPAGVGPLAGGDRLEGWMEVDGKEIKAGRIEVDVEEASGEGGYEFREA